MEKIKRGRPTLLGNELKRVIASYKDKYPDWSAQRILDKIHRDYFCLLKDKHPKWSDSEVEAKIVLPGLNRVQRYIKEITPKDNKPSELDSPWCLGLMSTSPAIVKKMNIPTIPGEAVPYILEVQSWLEGLPDHGIPAQRTLTVRHALWIGRLFGIVARDPANPKYQPVGKYLFWRADAFGSLERVCELSRTTFDTSILDKKLRKGEELIDFDNIATETIFANGREYSVDNLLKEIEKEGETK